MNSFTRFFSRLIVLCLLVSVSPVKAAGAALDLPSFFYSLDSTRVKIEFGLGDFDPEENSASLFSSSFRTRVGSNSTAGLVVPYYSVKAPDRVLFGFGDCAVNFTARIKGDSLGTEGIFFRFDSRLPTGSKTLYPYSLQSFDGGGGFELRKSWYSLYLKGAVTYVFAGEKEYEGARPYSNYLLSALYAELGVTERFSVAGSAYNVRFSKLGQRWVLNTKMSLALDQYMSLSLLGGAEIGESEERLYDSFVAFYISFLFPSGEDPEAD